MCPWKILGSRNIWEVKIAWKMVPIAEIVNSSCSLASIWQWATWSRNLTDGIQFAKVTGHHRHHHHHHHHARSQGGSTGSIDPPPTHTHSRNLDRDHGGNNPTHDCSIYKYDWLESAWIWLAAQSHKYDLTKYDWRRQLGDGGSGD